MTKHNLIETFFPRPEECVDFFVRLKKLVKASDDGKCFAELEKMDKIAKITLVPWSKYEKISKDLKDDEAI